MGAETETLDGSKILSMSIYLQELIPLLLVPTTTKPLHPMKSQLLGLMILLCVTLPAIVRRFSITVRNLDEAPTDIIFPSAPIPEGQPIGRELGTLIAIDGDGLSGFDPMDGLEAWYDFENVTGNAVPDRNDKYPATLHNGAAISPVGCRLELALRFPLLAQVMTELVFKLTMLQVLMLMVFGLAQLGLRSFIHKASGVHFSGEGGNHVPIISGNSDELGFYDNETGRGWISSGFEMKVE